MAFQIRITHRSLPPSPITPSDTKTITQGVEKQLTPFPLQKEIVLHEAMA